MFKTRIVSAVALLAVACSTAPPPAPSPQKPAALGSIERLDPAFDELVPKDAQLEKVAGGFTFIEGPLWRPSGALWFSDVAGNVVRQWSPDGTVTEILNPGGYDGKVRIFEVPDGKLTTAFNPVPIKEADKVAAAGGDSGK